MKVKLHNYFYRDNKSDNEKYNAPLLFFTSRDEQGDFFLLTVCDKENLAPEMYVPLNEIQEEMDMWDYVVDVIFDSPQSNYQEKTAKITTTFPWQVKQLRKRFSHTFNADIKWEKMCLQKMGLTTPFVEVPERKAKMEWLNVSDFRELPLEEHFIVPIKVISWDIETDVSKVFPKFNGYEDARICPIISITGHNNYKNEFHEFLWHTTIDRPTDYYYKKWLRKGKYYVPAQKKLRKYNIKSEVFRHEYDTEEEMLKGYFDWYAKIRPDAQFGFNSEGGYKISKGRKRWFNGFDMPYLYERTKTLGLLKDLQKLSPLPPRMEGVKWRQNGENYHVEIAGVCSVDFIYSNAIFNYHEKFTDFREGNLQGYMSYFLGFGKVEHTKEHVWEMWNNNTVSDYNPSNPEQHKINKQENLVKKLYEEAKNANI